MAQWGERSMPRSNRMWKALVAAVIACGFAPAPALAAALLPNGEQVFLDNDGNPLAAGTVTFYIPNTTTFKDTWKDPDQNVLNTNPVMLDSAGRAIIYGSGVYRQVVEDVFGNVIWDQLTADPSSGNLMSWGGTSTGSANAQLVDGTNFGQLNGQTICFRAGFTNTAALTIEPSNSPAIEVRRDSASGPVPLVGGEVVANNVPCVIYDTAGGFFHLIAQPQYIIGALTNLAAGTTTDLGTVTSHNVNVTGTASITSFGTSARSDYPLYYLTFAGGNTLTYNGTSLILPGGVDITTAAGDTAVAMYLGSGNWRVISYTVAIAPVAPQVIAGGYRNLVVTGTTNTQATVTADAMTVETTSGVAYRLSAVSVTCDITTSGAGGLDTGVETPSTWYSIWTIYAPSTGTTACLLSISTTSPTMPATYTAKARWGWVRNDGSSNFWRTIQRGNTAQIIIGTNPTTLPTLSTGSTGNTGTPTWTAIALANFVPSTASKIRLFSSLTGTIITAPSNSYGGIGSTTNTPPAAYTTNASVQVYVVEYVLESSNIYVASTGGSVFLMGWSDNL